MKYISTNNGSKGVSFADAAFRGLAPDGGLYLPDSWPTLKESFISNIQGKSFGDIAFAISRLFIDELDDDTLRKIVSDAFNFEVPLVTLEENLQILELFHGPTLAFKDFGARFMSRIFSALRDKQDQDLVILVATSGDTGSAVAQGFLGVEGIKVCLLYPSGQVSKIQEQQLTTAGQNVTALEVDGTFDDCQKMVKEAFSDQQLNEQLMLSSANSINIARLLPQSFYYWHAAAQLPGGEAPIFCVPSGNFGNLTAGLMAKRMGMPAEGFIAATNKNDIVPAYLQTGDFNPRPSQRTISNAMDVGNPSNFARMRTLYDNSQAQMKSDVWGASFQDLSTREAIRKVYDEYNYLMDPHTAVGYLAVQEYQKNNAGYFGESDAPFIILSTAHPAKFSDIIEPVIAEEVPMPERLEQCLHREKQSAPMSASYKELKQWLMKQYS